MHNPIYIYIYILLLQNIYCCGTRRIDDYISDNIIIILNYIAGQKEEDKGLTYIYTYRIIISRSKITYNILLQFG